MRVIKESGGFHCLNDSLVFLRQSIHSGLFFFRLLLFPGFHISDKLGMFHSPPFRLRMSCLIRVISNNAEILLFIKVINSSAIVCKAVRFHCPVYISPRCFFRFFKRWIVQPFVEAVLKMVIDHHPIRGFHMVCIAVHCFLLGLGEKPVLLNELGNPALYFGPGQLCPFGGFRANRQRAFIVLSMKFTGQPFGGVFFPRMVVHIADNCVFALNIAVPCTDGIVNIILRERTQHFMEAWVGFVNYFPVQALPELRHIGIKAEQSHVAGPQDGTANGSVALDHSIFPVGMAAGIAVSGVLDNGLQHNGLVLFMQFPNGRLCRFCLGIAENSGPVRTELRFMGIDVPFCFMVDGRQ